MSCWLENPPILNQKFPLGQLKYSEYISSWVLITSIITESGIGLERDLKIEFLLWTLQSSYRVLMPCAASPSLLPPVTNDWGCSSLHPWVLIAPKSHSLITEYQHALGNIFWSSTETWASTAVLGQVRTPSVSQCILCGGVCPFGCGYSLSQPTGWHWGHWECWRKCISPLDQLRPWQVRVRGLSWCWLDRLCPAGTGQMPLRGNTLVWEYKVYKGDCEYHVCFGQGIAYFFDMKAELGDKMLHMFHQFGILFPHQLHLIWASPISSAHPLPAYLCWCCSPSNNQASNQFPPSGSWGIASSWLALSHGQPWTPQWLLEQCFWELQLLLIVPQLLIWAVFLVPGHVAWLY